MWLRIFGFYWTLKSIRNTSPLISSCLEVIRRRIEKMIDCHCVTWLTLCCGDFHFMTCTLEEGKSWAISALRLSWLNNWCVSLDGGRSLQTTTASSRLSVAARLKCSRLSLIKQHFYKFIDLACCFIRQPPPSSISAYVGLRMFMAIFIRRRRSFMLFFSPSPPHIFWICLFNSERNSYHMLI